VLGFAAIEA